MMSVNLKSEDIQLIDEYNLIKNTTSIKNKAGAIKRYISYNFSFPYLFIKLFNHPDLVYFYEHLGKIYVTNTEPSNLFSYKKVALHCRKNSSQKTSRENKDKQWAKLVTIPKTIMGNVGDFNKLNYILHCNQKDYVNGEQGLLEVYLS
ncbi:hypothetical protein [Methanosphaera sp.]